MRTPARRTAWLWDAEIDLGITRRVELDVETAVRVDGPASRPQQYDAAAFDHLWLATKLRLLELTSGSDVWAFGAQLGPKLPAAPGAKGAGFETILVAEWTRGGTHAFGNLGAFVDPGRQVARDRPTAIEWGVTIDQDLDERNEFSILAALGSVHAFSRDPDQTAVTAGLAWMPFQSLTFSALVFGGIEGTDAGGVMLGVVPRIPLWQ